MAPFDTVLITNKVFGVPLPSAQFGPDGTTIEPEENGLRNWTMVLPTLSYRPQRLMPEAYDFSRS
jgi:hypothetical protein